MKKQGIIGLAVLTALAATAAIALTLGDDETAEETNATPTIHAEHAAADVVQRFVEALATGNVDQLYALQQEDYKRVCSREAFQAFATRLRAQPLEGPAQIVVRGDRADAGLMEVQPDGTRARVVVPLVREANADWRLAAPSATGCEP